jgi:hypothetical protein
MVRRNLEMLLLAVLRELLYRDEHRSVEVCRTVYAHSNQTDHRSQKNTDPTLSSHAGRCIFPHLCMARSWVVGHDTVCMKTLEMETVHDP